MSTKLHLLLLMCFVMLSTKPIWADLQSTTGSINFDANSDGNNELSLSASGLGVGINSPSSNLHVMGNASINDNLYVASTSGNSSLEINGSIGFNVETVSANATLSTNSFVIVDTSSDNVELSLPYAGNAEGRHYSIKKISQVNKLWVMGGGNLIDDMAPVEITNAANTLPHLSVISDGRQWFISSFAGISGTIAEGNLLGWWKLDETSGNSAADATGRNASGNLTDTITFDNESVTGIHGRALDLGGISAMVDAGDESHTAPTNALTLSLWAKFASLSNDQMLAARHNSSNYGYALWKQSGQLRFILGDSTNDSYFGCITSESNLTAGVWHHIVGTFDGSTGIIYIDGQVKDTFSKTLTIDYSAVTNPLRIGSREGLSHFFNGVIDDVRLYNHALSSNEVLALHQAGTPGD